MSNHTLSLKADGLTLAFGKRVALKNVSLETHPGELIAVVGPNGAGKSTLLQILAGILTPTSGSVPVRPTKIGWVPQAISLYNRLTVTENLKMFAHLEKLDDPDGGVEKMLDLIGLGSRRNEQVQNLSIGNKQRLNIAIGLLASPSVVLLDEPTASLDSRQRGRLWEFVRNLADSGTTVLYATHTVGEAEGLAHRVLILADGELLFSGTPEALVHEVQDEAAKQVEGNGQQPFTFETAFIRFLEQQGR